MRTIDAIAVRIKQRGVATVVYKGSDVVIPAGDGPFVSLIETAGRLTQVHNASSILEPAIQVTVRGGKFDATGAIVDLAWDELGGKDKIVNMLIGDVFFLWLHPVQPPFQLPNDPQGRVRLSFNLALARR